jgi:hypothetical protein
LIRTAEISRPRKTTKQMEVLRMAAFNKFEYGQVIRANLKQDVSTNTGLEMIIQPELGSSKNASRLNNENPRGAVIANNPDVTVGTVDVVVGDETYLSNEYLEYTIKENDLSKSGIWRVKGLADITTTNRVTGDYVRFSVLD